MNAGDERDHAEEAYNRDLRDNPDPDSESGPDPLAMALNCVDAVLRTAQYQEQDPVQAYIAKAGTQGWHAAQLGACMALVSMAGDLRQIRQYLGELRT